MQNTAQTYNKKTYNNSQYQSSKPVKKTKKTLKGRDFWGPVIWAVIHILSACLNPDNSKVFITFLVCLSYLLPCEKCKKHLKYNLQRLPPADHLSNNEDAFLYSYTLHDVVNEDVNTENEKNPKKGFVEKKSPLFDDIRSFYFVGVGMEKHPTNEFNHKEYSTSDNNSLKEYSVVGKDFWGPPIWTMIHILAATLRPENAIHFKTLLECLSILIPCQKSRYNFSKILDDYPPGPYLTNNDDAFFYTYLIHDVMNEYINDEMESRGDLLDSVSVDESKKSNNMKESPLFDDIKKFYFMGLAQECKDCHVG